MSKTVEPLLRPGISVEVLEASAPEMFEASSDVLVNHLGKSAIEEVQSSVILPESSYVSIRVKEEPSAHFVGEKTLWVVGNIEDTNEQTETAEVSKNGLARFIGKATHGIGEVLKSHRKRTAMLALVSTLANVGLEAGVEVGSANAQLAKIGNSNVPCPDPSVIEEPWNHHNLIAECTSDYGQKNFLFGGGFGSTQAAIPTLESGDGGLHWQFRNYVFPNGSHPAQAEAPLGNWPGPRYWAPAGIYNPTNGLFETYLATGINAGTATALRGRGIQANEGEMAIFVAWAKNPFGGQWNSKLLRVRGEFNNISGNTKESMGGLIDPTVARDPKTGQLLLGYTVQPNQTFIEQLTPDGLNVSKHIRRISWANLPWENGVEEGGVLHWDQQQGVMEEELNTASTWGDGGHGYKTKFIASADPLNGPWVEYKKPILVDGNGYYNPGLGSPPITLPNGKTYIFYHVLTRPKDHESQDRVLYRSEYHLDSNRKIYVPDGMSDPGTTTGEKDIYYYDKQDKKFMPAAQYAQQAQAAGDSSRPQRQYLQVSVPMIGRNGRP